MRVKNAENIYVKSPKTKIPAHMDIMYLWTITSITFIKEIISYSALLSNYKVILILKTVAFCKNTCLMMYTEWFVITDLFT